MASETLHHVLSRVFACCSPPWDLRLVHRKQCLEEMEGHISGRFREEMEGCISGGKLLWILIQYNSCT